MVWKRSSMFSKDASSSGVPEESAAASVRAAASIPATQPPMSRENVSRTSSMEKPEKLTVTSRRDAVGAVAELEPADAADELRRQRAQLLYGAGGTFRA